MFIRFRTVTCQHSAINPEVPPTVTQVLGDPFWNYVVLNLRMENLLDDRQHAVIPQRGASLSTEQAKFGTSSLKSSLVTGSFLELPYHTDYDLAGYDFTLDFWVFPSRDSYSSLCGNTIYNVYGGFCLQQNANRTVVAYINIGGSWYNFTTKKPFGQQVWNHFALCRTNSSWYVLINGQVDTTFTLSNSNPANVKASWYIAATNSTANNLAGQGFDGYIDGFRLTKGINRYASTSLQLTKNPNTELEPYKSSTTFLLDYQNPDSAYIDQSDKALLISSTNLQPCGFNNGSFYLDGTAYGKYAVNSAFDLAASDITIEFWCYLIARGSGFFLTISPPTNTINAWQIELDGSNMLRAHLYVEGIGTVAFVKDSVAFPLNQLVHVAWVRSGTTFKLYKNGVSVGTSSSGSPAASSCALAIGDSVVSHSRGTTRMSGYLSKIRVTKSAVYTANFTPPTGDLSVGPNTVLLLNMKNSSSNMIVDSSSYGRPIKNNGSVGQAMVQAPDSTVKGVLKFNQANYLTVPASTDWIFDGDYTIECWVYPLSTALSHVFGGGGSGSQDQFYYQAGTPGLFGWGDVNWYYTHVNIPLNQWTHLAATRQGSITKGFVNGVCKITSTLTGAIGRNAPQYIGYRVNGNSAVNGYLSQLQVIKGYCYYTVDFTPSPVGDPTRAGLLLYLNDTPVHDLARSSELSRIKDCYATKSNQTKAFNRPSHYFNGEGYLKIAHHAALKLGGTYTIDGWFQLMGNASDYILIDKSAGSARTYAVSLIKKSATLYNLRYTYQNTSGTFISLDGSLPIYLGEWYHFAVTYDLTAVTLYLNGVLDTRAAATTIRDSGLSPDPLAIGARTNGSLSFYGQLYGIRLTETVRPISELASTDLTTASEVTSDYLGQTDILVSVNPTSSGHNLQFFDTSDFNHALMVTGTVEQGIDNKGPALAVASGSYLKTNPSTAFGFGTGDFTVECWLNPDQSSYSSTSQRYFIECCPNETATYGFVLGLTPTNNLAFYNRLNASSPYLSTVTVLRDSRTYTHIAVSREAGTLRIFIDGKLSGSFTDAGFDLGASQSLTIGSSTLSSGGLALSCRIQQLRMVKRALYVQDFTLSSSVTKVADTCLLLNINPLLVDYQKLQLISGFGAVSSSTSITVDGSPSFYTDGSSYVVVNNRNNSLILPSDFTIETWFWATRTAYEAVFELGSYPYSVLLRSANGDTTYTLYVSNVLYATLPALPRNTWNHVAIVRSSNIVYVFFNGRQVYYSILSPIVINSPGSPLFIGGQVYLPTEARAQHYFHNFRVSKIARYTADFTPAKTLAKPFKNIVDNSVLACAFTQDLKDENNHEWWDTSAQIVNQALYLNGSQYASMPNDDFLFDYRDFTVECWINPVELRTTGSYPTLIGNMNAGSSSVYWSFGPLDTGCLRYYEYGKGAYYQVTSTTAIPVNKWTHIAVVQCKGDIFIFMNGVKCGSLLGKGVLTASTVNPLTLGCWGTSFYHGYIKNLRISKSARYLADFIPADFTSIPEPLEIDAYYNTTVVHIAGEQQLIDLRGNKLINVGTPRLSFSQVHGTSNTSIYLDGTSSLQIDVTKLDLSNNYTIECWVYPLSNTLSTVFANFTNTATSGAIWLGYDTKFKLAFNKGVGTPDIQSSVSVQYKWQHLAVTVHNGQATLWVDGVDNGQLYVSTALAKTGTNWSIGVANTSPATMYFQDFRISSFARYHKNFVPLSKVHVVGSPM